MPTINKQSCPTCGQSINVREIALFSGMVDALWAVVKWCVANQTDSFSRKEIKHLLETDGQVARFGDWEMFGGFVSRNGRGNYKLDKELTKKFLEGQLEIPIKVTKDPFTDEVTPIAWGTIQEVPNISKFLDSNGDYVARYGRRHG